MVSEGEGSVDNLLSWILSTQVGDPLAHCREGFGHCISTDRLTGLSVGSKSHGEDEEHVDLVVRRGITEGRASANRGAEGGPLVEDLVAGFLVLRGSGASGERERSAEISLELVSLSR